MAANNTRGRQECILALSLHSLEDSRPGSSGPYVSDRGLQHVHAHGCGSTKDIITNGSAWMQAVNSGVPTRCTMAGLWCTRAFVQSASCLHTFKVLLACTHSRDASYMHAVSLLQERSAPSAVTHRISTLHPYNTSSCPHLQLIDCNMQHQLELHHEVTRRVGSQVVAPCATAPASGYKGAAAKTNFKAPDSGSPLSECGCSAKWIMLLSEDGPFHYVGYHTQDQ